MKPLVVGIMLLAAVSAVAWKRSASVSVVTTPVLFSVSGLGEATDLQKFLACDMAKLDLNNVLVKVCEAHVSIYKKTLPATECDCALEKDAWTCSVQGYGVCESKGIVTRKIEIRK